MLEVVFSFSSTLIFFLSFMSYSEIVNVPIRYKDYQIKNLTLRDWGEFCDYYVFAPYRLAKKNNVDALELKDIFSQCLEHRRNIDPQTEEVTKYAGSVEGFFKLLELALIRGGLSPKKAQELIDTEEEELYLELVIPFYSLLGFNVSGVDTENPQTPNQSTEQKK